MFDFDHDILIIIQHKGVIAEMVIIDPTAGLEEVSILELHIVVFDVFFKVSNNINLFDEFETGER